MRRPIQVITGECSAFNSISTFASRLPASWADSSDVFESSPPNSALGFSGGFCWAAEDWPCWSGLDAGSDRAVEDELAAPCSCAATMPSVRKIHNRPRVRGCAFIRFMVDRQSWETHLLVSEWYV